MCRASWLRHTAPPKRHPKMQEVLCEYSVDIYRVFHAYKIAWFLATREEEMKTVIKVLCRGDSLSRAATY